MQNKLLILIILISRFSFSQEKIQVGKGPEDFVLDTLNQNRILISCDPRREDKNYTKQGDIWEYNLLSKKTKVLPRFKEPKNLSFNPHGIHFIIEKNVPYLFVVNHYKPKGGRKSEILRYKVLNDSLIFDERYPYTSTINSVYAFSKNHFLITNDKKLMGNLVEFKNNTYTKIDKNIGYPNGINVKDSILYLSTTTSNKIIPYKIEKNGSYTRLKKIAKVKGADNIRFYKNLLITTSHPKLMRVIKHFKNPEKKSPTRVYSINLKNNKKTLLYKNDGSIINAASTALVYDGYLYIAQIFEPYILKIKMP